MMLLSLGSVCYDETKHQTKRFQMLLAHCFYEHQKQRLSVEVYEHPFDEGNVTLTLLVDRRPVLVEYRSFDSREVSGAMNLGCFILERYLEEPDIDIEDVNWFLLYRLNQQ